MSDRLEALMTRKYTDGQGNPKTAYTKIGMAWPLKNGGYSLVFDALPTPSLNDKGGIETRVLLVAPKDTIPRGDSQQRATASDDEVPF